MQLGSGMVRGSGGGDELFMQVRRGLAHSSNGRLSISPFLAFLSRTREPVNIILIEKDLQI